MKFVFCSTQLLLLNCVTCLLLTGAASLCADTPPPETVSPPQENHPSLHYQYFSRLDTPSKGESSASDTASAESPSSSIVDIPSKNPPAPTAAPISAPQPLPEMVILPKSPPANSTNQPASTPPADTSVPQLPVNTMPSLPSTPTPSTTPSDQKGSGSGNAQAGYTINFNNVGIIEFIRFVAKISNSNFIFDQPQLQFNVTLVSEEPTSLQDIMAALVQILRIHGLSLLQQGNNVMIYQNADISKFAKVVSEELHNTQDENSPIITRVFRLRNINPDNVATIIRPMLSAAAVVEVSSSTRHLIVTDISTNIEKISQLLKSLDAPNTALDIGSFAVQNSLLPSLMGTAQQILSPLAEGNTFILVPQPVSNTIFIISTPYLIDRAIKILETLDAAAAKPEAPKPLPSAPGTPALPPPPPPFADGAPDNTNFYIYKVQYHVGSDIQASLSQIGQSLSQQAAGQPGASNQDLINTISSIQWIQTSNTLVFTGSQASLAKVRALLLSLDTPLKEVFIEVLVLRTTLINSLSFGVEWGTQKATSSGNNIINAGVGSSGTPSVLPGLLTTGASPTTSVIPLNSGFSTGVIGTSISLNGKSFSSIGLLVNALKTDSNTDILLNPKIVTQDNNTATIFVGSNNPFQTQSIVAPGSTNVEQSFDYRNVGTSLQITPILGESNIITLNINQEISTVDTPPTGLSNLTPTTSRTTTQTRVTVPDDHFLVLSGMISDTDQTMKSGIPCLGGIPGVGAAFGNTSHTIQKDNLIIFIRPHIVMTAAEMDALTKDEENLYKFEQKKGLKHDTETFLKRSNLQ